MEMRSGADKTHPRGSGVHLKAKGFQWNRLQSRGHIHPLQRSLGRSIQKQSAAKVAGP